MIYDMWESLMGILPEKLILLCTVLAFLVPYIVYKINEKLHKYGDPPWKKEGYDKNQGNQ